MSKIKRDQLIANRPIVAWIVSCPGYDDAVTFAQTSSRAKGNAYASAKDIDIDLNWNGLRVRRAKQYDRLAGQLHPRQCMITKYADDMLQAQPELPL